MLKHKRLVSIIAAIAFCLSFLAPAIIAPAPAVAAATYTPIVKQDITQINTRITTSSLQIDVAEVKALASGDTLSIHLPSGLTMDNGGDGITTVNNPKVAFSRAGGADQTIAGPANYTNPPAGPNVRVSAPANINSSTTNGLNAATWVAYAVGNTIIEIKMVAPAGTNGPGRLFVDFTNVLVTDSFDGEIKVNAFATGSGFETKLGIPIANYASSAKGTFAAVGSVKSMHAAGTIIDTIMIQETYKNSIANSEKIKLKLPAGFAWDLDAAEVKGAWAFQGLTFTPGKDDSRTLTVTAPAAGLGALDNLGRIFIGGLRVYVDDENVAKKGDVTVDISGSNVTNQTIVVAKYSDYEVTVEEKEVKEVISGKWDTELGSFLITEEIQGSLIPGRTIKFTLPEGVKWDYRISGNATAFNYDNPSDVITATAQKGINFGNYSPAPPATGSQWSIDSSKRVLTLTLPSTIPSKSSVLFEKLKVVISPAFSGDIVLDVSGTAGASGQVKVATVKPVVTMEATAAPNVIIGMQGQPIADVTLTEGAKEAFDSVAGKNVIRLMLPPGARFDNLPKYEVIEGDLSVDDINYVAGHQGIDIRIKSTSTKPPTIKLSNMSVTVDRTLPEGDLKLAVKAEWSTSIAESYADRTGVKVFNIEDVTDVVVGKCITPAGQQGRSATFYIGSTIYNVNGANQIMDVAPYIKAGRTYVPVRYLGEALGANVDWDEVTKTVTVTKGDKSVVLVIGSTIAKVNGADVQMDVAPEIVNGRTMLPARWVAEGLGYAVGWNEVLKQVVVQELL